MNSVRGLVPGCARRSQESWESVLQFKNTQRVWVTRGLVLIGISIAISIITAAVGGAAAISPKSRPAAVPQA